METNNKNSKPKLQIFHSMKRSSSSNSDALAFESPHSPLRHASPFPSDQGDPPESTPYASPIASPEKSSHFVDNSKAVVALDKFTQCSPAPSHLPPLNNSAAKPQPPPVTLNRAVREEGPPPMRKVGPEGTGSVASVLQRSKREKMIEVAELGLRASEVILCLISFSVMAADRTQGWSGDSFDRYIEYRYCLTVNVIGFVYSGFQAYDLAYHFGTRKHVIRHHLRRHFNFFIDQVLAYLLISSSSSAATRVDDWQSNWGKDDFTVMASASVAIAFLAFFAFAASSLISGYNLCNPVPT